MAKNKLENELEVNAPLNENLANPAVDNSKTQKANKEKKPNVFTKLGGLFKDMFAELKRVTWPTWKVAATSLLTVLVVVLVFLVIVMGFDFGATKLLELLFKAA